MVQGSVLVELLMVQSEEVEMDETVPSLLKVNGVEIVVPEVVVVPSVKVEVVNGVEINVPGVVVLSVKVVVVNGVELVKFGKIVRELLVQSAELV